MQLQPATDTIPRLAESEMGKEAPASENNKSRESSDGQAANLHHDRTSEQFNALEDNLLANANVNPRNKSTFSK